MTHLPIPPAGDLMLLAASFVHGDQERSSRELHALVERGFAPVDIAYATVMLDVAIAGYAGGEPVYRVLDAHTGLVVGIEDAEPPYRIAAQFAYAIADGARAARDGKGDAAISTAQDAARSVYADGVADDAQLARHVQQVLSTYLWSRSRIDQIHLAPRAGS